jgi:hypothetical protein
MHTRMGHMSTDKREWKDVDRYNRRKKQNRKTINLSLNNCSNYMYHLF